MQASTLPYGYKHRHIKARQGRVQELCENGGGCPGLPGPNGLYCLCGRKATLNVK